MTDDDEFEQMMMGIKEGDDDAAAQIWENYSQNLLRYAKRKLGDMSRRAVDEEDVTLSAVNSFLSCVQAGRLDPQNPNELWKLLATFTVRKATEHLRRHYAAKRGGGRVRGESAFVRADNPNDTSAGINQVMDERNLAKMSDQLLELSEERLARLDDDLREVAMLKLEGYTNREIAERRNCAERTVERMVKRVRELWQEQDKDLG